MRTPRAALVGIIAAASLSGCAAGGVATGPSPEAPESSGRPAGELTTRTMVIDHGDGPELCVGGVGESLPPSCGGPDVIGWDWADVEGEESRSGATWGEYEVFGTFDGTSFTLTRPPESYDPHAASSATPLPEPTPGDPADAEAVARAVEDYSSRMGSLDGPLSVGEYRGRASVTVIYDDDGRQQAEADAAYGEGVVEVWSTLRPASGD
jgi:hypothetical protein